MVSKALHPFGSASLILFLVLAFAGRAFAQPTADRFNTWRITEFTGSSDTIQIDTATIIPSTFRLKDVQSGVDINPTEFSLSGSSLILQPKWVGKQLEARYRVLALSFRSPQMKKDTSWIGRGNSDEYFFDVYDPYSEEQSVFDFDGLDYSGSFVRGISFGNNQDLVLNSSFNLQIAGNLGDDIEILAAISDKHIPLQPEGNTQQIQEFDKLFIQLKKDRTTLVAGDYTLRRPKGYFQNYFKTLQGLSLETGADLKQFGDVTIRGFGAVPERI